MTSTVCSISRLVASTGKLRTSKLTRAMATQSSRTRAVRPQQHSSHCRAFTTSLRRSATIIKANPRTDDDGDTMHIHISDRAAKRLNQIVTTPPKRNSLTSTSSAPDSHLRVTVTAGGCHGFQYLMSLEPAEKIDKKEDTVFEFQGSEGTAQVVMDQPSLELLKGSTVDFTTELIGSSFKITGNPRATSSCGCGTSFDVE